MQVLWLSAKSFGFHPTFSRHGIAQILSAWGEFLWLDEKVRGHPPHSVRLKVCLLASGVILSQRPQIGHLKSVYRTPLSSFQLFA